MYVKLKVLYQPADKLALTNRFSSFSHQSSTPLPVANSVESLPQFPFPKELNSGRQGIASMRVLILERVWRHANFCCSLGR